MKLAAIASNLLGFGQAMKTSWPPRVGTSASDVVVRENKMTLIRYRATAPRKFSRPVLLVPSLINRHYVLDLNDERSFAADLGRRGFDVYCIRWGTPTAEDRYLTFDDVCAGYIGRAVRYAARQSPSKDVHVLGYCLGGTFATAYAAAYPEHVATLTALATPIDFDHAGVMKTWVRTPSFDLETLRAAFANVPHRLMHGAFHLLRPTLNATKLVSIAENGGNSRWRSSFLPVERWSTDNVSFPGGVYQRYIEGLYRNNELVRGQFSLRGRPARLESIRCPVHVVCFEGDTIVPETSALPLAELVTSSDITVWMRRGSHVGSVVSLSAKDGVWKQMADFWATRDRSPLRQTGSAVATAIAS